MRIIRSSYLNMSSKLQKKKEKKNNFGHQRNGSVKSCFVSVTKKIFFVFLGMKSLKIYCLRKGHQTLIMR